MAYEPGNFKQSVYNSFHHNAKTHNLKCLIIAVIFLWCEFTDIREISNFHKIKIVILLAI
jgi:hypothetical protein